MAPQATSGGAGRGMRWRIIGWGAIAVLLLLPWIANAPWTAGDFIFMGVLLGSVGLAIEFLVRLSSSPFYRLGAVLAVLGIFLTIWVNAAVGMIGPEGNPLNLLFGGVLLIALVGAVLARFRPSGMARALVVTAIAQGAAGATGLFVDVRGAVLSIVFAGLWLLAAALFHIAALDPRAGEEAGHGR